jgi:glycosyltransferase involved in cell wall biosynthesis
VIESASDEVVFLGAIYAKEDLNALRKFSRFYIHGHQVGGTNPSLVEAIGAKNAILAHDNKFNRWVAKNGALYFSNERDISFLIDRMFKDDATIITLREASNKNFYENFTWPLILNQYESLCENWMDWKSEKHD